MNRWQFRIPYPGSKTEFIYGITVRRHKTEKAAMKSIAQSLGFKQLPAGSQVYEVIGNPLPGATYWPLRNEGRNPLPAATYWPLRNMGRNPALQSSYDHPSEYMVFKITSKDKKMPCPQCGREVSSLFTIAHDENEAKFNFSTDKDVSCGYDMIDAISGNDWTVIIPPQKAKSK